MSDEHKQYASTAAITLEAHILSVHSAKGEAEWWAHKEILRLRAENEKLRAALHDIYEVYAGSEGLPGPETCSEVYLYALVEEMARIAAKHKRAAALKETGDDLR